MQDMTVTEAIDWLRKLREHYSPYGDYGQALTVAIESLEHYISLPNEVFEVSNNV